MKVIECQYRLSDIETVILKQREDLFTGYASYKFSIGDWRVNHAVLDHENVRGCCLSDVPHGIGDHGIVKSLVQSLAQHTGIVGVQAAGPGIDLYPLGRTLGPEGNFLDRI